MWPSDVDTHVNLTSLRARLAWLRKRGRIQEAGVPGHVATSASVGTNGKKNSGKCPRCGEQEIDQHRIWQSNHHGPHGSLNETPQHVRERALTRGELRNPCFWLRGIVPAGMTTPPSPEDGRGALARNHSGLQTTHQKEHM